ncbi:uncharacterized protein BCR38DRAFT_159714 [Pseudomassariella vexata]|uniref:Uncharacterized protein n=1 Tax=Pseudomassariella vexata TaxID=1141098 RepID=A0A1Y2E7L0_9PEZI|nr:uncharacterized protein BCR38DRAFT_159714 [Pseudomassariella vexata]ORY67532.1 hypothetical protein BCR38DRAFT_159714 [Pseudomassariella vexata]
MPTVRANRKHGPGRLQNQYQHHCPLEALVCVTSPSVSTDDFLCRFCILPFSSPLVFLTPPFSPGPFPLRGSSRQLLQESRFSQALPKPEIRNFRLSGFVSRLPLFWTRRVSYGPTTPLRTIPRHSFLCTGLQLLTAITRSRCIIPNCSFYTILFIVPPLAYFTVL